MTILVGGVFVCSQHRARGLSSSAQSHLSVLYQNPYKLQKRETTCSAIELQRPVEFDADAADRTRTCNLVIINEMFVGLCRWVREFVFFGLS